MKILRYIHQHIDQPLSIEELATMAKISKYHFHRQFSAFVGVSVGSYIKRLRMHKSAYQLSYRNHLKVIDIAIQCGFDSQEGFSRAFKQQFGNSPSHFRQDPDWQILSVLEKILNQNEYMLHTATSWTVDIIEFEPVEVALMLHHGSSQDIGASLRRFIAWRKQNRLPPQKNRTFNLLYDDPQTTAENDYRFGLAVQLNPSEKVELAPGMSITQLPRQTVARVRNTGTEQSLTEIVKYLYCHWLEKHNQRPGDFPVFFERLCLYPDVPFDQALTDVYMPLK